MLGWVVFAVFTFAGVQYADLYNENKELRDELTQHSQAESDATE